jgi:hypothetical protein
VLRLIVIGVSASGESFIQQDEELPANGRLWDAIPADFRKMADTVGAGKVHLPAQPPEGGAIWAMASVSPGDTPAGVANNTMATMDSRGFHVTRSIDFIYVLDDGLVLDLDTASVTLSAGNAVVLQAARHAWRNGTNRDVRFIDVLMDAG